MKSDAMKAAIQAIVVPVLRQAGFRGSAPHFRRILEDRIDLLTFQFDKWGGGFVIEISKCPPSGFTTHWGKVISPSKVSAQDISPNQRLRIQPEPKYGTDSWFRFEQGDYDSVAKSVLLYLPQAEQWWSSTSNPSPNDNPT
jgi:Domain of unknown function (DUF4304)